MKSLSWLKKKFLIVKQILKKGNMSEKQKVFTIHIINNTDKEFKDVSILKNRYLSSELEFSPATLKESFDFVGDLKEPKDVFVFRYQFICEDTENREKQLDSKFTIKYGKNGKEYNFLDLFSHYQKQRDILDILGEFIDLRLSNDLDIILQRIMPKTQVVISFFINE